MRREYGAVTLWILGLCVSLLFLGGISLDLWRAVGARRAMSEAVDAAAVAGANGLDEDALRRGSVRLEPGRAEVLARENLRARPVPPGLRDVHVEVSEESVEVVGVGELPLSLLRIFVDADDLEITVRAVASPRRSG